MSAPHDTVTGFAYEADGVRVPRERFYALACDPRRSVAVEACAGAGKTWMLVSRILRALLEGVPPHEILAITFTKKAAGEMRARLQDWLREFASHDLGRLQQELMNRGLSAADADRLAPALQGLNARLLAGGRPVQIRTFHSWFASLLRTAPLATVEALGLPARGELLEDDAEAVARVWRPFQHRVAADPAAREDFAACVAAHGRSQTRKALEAALDKRVEFSLADAEGVVDASVRRWTEVFADLAPALPGGAGGEGAAPASPRALVQAGPVREALFEAARALGRATQVSYSRAGSQLEQAVSANDLDGALQALLTKDGKPRKFGDKLQGIDTIRAAQDLVARVQAAEAQHQAWLHQGRMARLARLLIEVYADLKREQGWVDMSDVERAALKMLSDPVLSGWVQERLDARVSQLLVDEFQDTNPLQWQALHAWLSGYVGAGGDGPSVFIVGDPKQSIYRFRRAEPQVFRAAQRFVVGGLGGVLLGCDHTRRNAPAVLEAVNAALLTAQDAGQYEGFRVHTTESEEAGQVLALPPIPRPGDDDDAADGAAPEAGQGADPADASAAAAAAPAAVDADAALGGSGWRDSLSEPREVPEERLLALECRQAARWVASRIAGGLPPGEVMVLARRRDRLVAMAEALRALGVPAQQADKSDLGDAPEVQDLVALVDVLVSPAHDLSLARALKSPVFGAGDAGLAWLAGRARERAEPGVRLAWLDLLLEAGSEAGLPPLLAAAAHRLARWKRWVDAWPPHDALDAIFHDGDVLARYAAASPPALRASVLANLRALLQAALEAGGGRFLTPYAFVRAMRAGGNRAPAVAASGAVRLLTVHGAKGLEAQLVLMLDTDGPAPRAETMGVVVDWPGEAPVPERFAFIASESRPPACCAELMARERQARDREELNALYVAMTRAQQQLALSCVTPHRPAPGSWWRRLEGLAVRVEGLDDEASKAGVGDGRDAQGVQTAQGAGHSAPAGPHAPASVIELAVVPGDVVLPAPPLGAGVSLASADVGQYDGTVDIAAAGDAAASERTRFGEAMHRLLEGVPLGRVPAPGDGWPPGLLQRVAREFRLTAGAMAEAVAMADRILGGEGAWAWDPARVEWADNEVPLHLDGALLRIDRLVRVRGEGDWWVFDYKSAAQPEADAGLRAQLARYRDAVVAQYPGARVHAGFLTGQGRLVRL